GAQGAADRQREVGLSGRRGLAGLALHGAELAVVHELGGGHHLGPRRGGPREAGDRARAGQDRVVGGLGGRGRADGEPGVAAANTLITGPVFSVALQREVEG
ncbi:MAG: hypothetical protein ACK559_20480, partial [bacterium]